MTLWVLAVLLLVVAVRSSQRFPVAHVAHAERERARRVSPLDDAAQEGRVGPCWDDAADELLHIGADRWLGVGCDVEGAPRAGESPQCTVLRERIAACLSDRRTWAPRPGASTPARWKNRWGDAWCTDDAPSEPGALGPTT